MITEKEIEASSECLKTLIKSATDLQVEITDLKIKRLEYNFVNVLVWNKKFEDSEIALMSRTAKVTGRILDIIKEDMKELKKTKNAKYLTSIILNLQIIRKKLNIK